MYIYTRKNTTTLPLTAIRSPHWRLGLLLLGLLAAFCWNLSTGPVPIPLRSLLALALGESPDAIWHTVFWQVRLPKALTAVYAGTALSVSGLLMQTLFRNPLASPSVMGITAGASLGVAAVVLLGGTGAGMYAVAGMDVGGAWALVLASALGGALVLALVLALAARLRDPVTLLVVGMMMSYLTAAVVSVWQYFSAPEQLQGYLLWTFGSLAGVHGAHLWTLGLGVGGGLLLSALLPKALNLYLLGDTYARSLGLDLRLLRLSVIAASSVLAGTVTAFCGPIGFVGIAVPHLCRQLLRSSDHRLLLPASALGGALLLLCCDSLGQMASSQYALPINAMTSLLGAPVALWVILRGRRSA